MASSSVLRLLGQAATAGGGYYSQVHAETSRTNRLLEARQEAERLRQAVRTEKIADRDEERAYKEKNAKATTSELQQKVDLYKNDPDAFAAIYGKTVKPTALEQKKALFENDPDMFKKLFPSGVDNESIESSTTRDTAKSRNADAIEGNKGLMALADDSRKGTRRYETILSLLDKVETGTFAETIVDVKKIAKSVGISVDEANVANTEQLMVLLGDEVMSRISETKGAVSEKEMELFQTYSAGLGKTAKGNRQIIEYKLAQGKRNIAVGDMIRKMRREDAPARDIENAVYEYINDPKNDLSTYLQSTDKDTDVTDQKALLDKWS